jgi:hypothetical protein
MKSENGYVLVKTKSLLYAHKFNFADYQATFNDVVQKVEITDEILEVSCIDFSQNGNKASESNIRQISLKIDTPSKSKHLGKLCPIII